MDANAYIGEVIAGCVYLFVGVRLYLMSRKTRHAPDKLIAASFLLWMLAYAFYDIPYAFVDSAELIPPLCSYGSLIALASGNVVFTFFIRAVFRSHARWSLWLVAAVALSNLLGVTGTGWLGDWDGINALANPWYWFECFGSFAPTIWMTAEGFAQYFKTRRQLKLGLCEPITCNRFLLWGIAGLLWLILEAIVTLNDVVYGLTGDLSEALGMGIALFEVAPMVVVWFVFFPPASYCRWIERASKPKMAVQ